MKITLNGKERTLDQAATVADLLSDLGEVRGQGRGVAVAVNGEVVPRSRWEQAALAADDRVEILRAVGGG